MREDSSVSHDRMGEVVVVVVVVVLLMGGGHCGDGNLGGEGMENAARSAIQLPRLVREDDLYGWTPSITNHVPISHPHYL